MEEKKDDANGVERIVKGAKPIVDKIMKEINNGYELVNYDVIQKEFGDTSLDLPKPGEMYAQVMTPGYILKLRLKHEGKRSIEERIYHSTLDGGLIKECSDEDFMP